MSRVGWLMLLILTMTPQMAGRQAPSSPAGPTALGSPAAAAGSARAARVIVIDAAHGGADAGARGPSGVQEAELTLYFAENLRGALERQGWQVVMTRRGTDNPGFDDRATVANGQRDAIFLTLHVSSTGAPGTARAYYFADRRAATGGVKSGRRDSAEAGLLRWEEAQEPFVEQSRRFAELLQVHLGRVFRGSPELPEAAVLRQLRTVAAPAVAVEVASVSVRDRKPLERMAPQLAEAVSRAVTSFRSIVESKAP